MPREAATLKVAVTAFEAFIVSEQPRPPVQAPLQPVNMEPASATAVSVMMLFGVKGALQVAPQLMPAGVLVTVPPPVPALVTVIWGGGPNSAVTLEALFIVTLQAPMPVHAPLQPTKVDRPEGVAVSMTVEAAGKSALHVAPQLMPAGELVTEPVPEPTTETPSVTGGIGVKVAVTDWGPVIVTRQGPLAAVHAPLQPLKSEPGLGVAVSVTVVSCVKKPLQEVPQVIPAGALVTVPAPGPLLDTVRLKAGSAGLRN